MVDKVGLLLDVQAFKAENERLRAALKTADTAIARYCSHQVGYQDAYVAFKDARTEIKAALGNQQSAQEK